MAKYLDVEQARRLTGLRLVLSPGIPGPWSEAAKNIVQVKKISHVKVRQELGGKNQELLEWTGQVSAPVAMFNDERPRTSWNEQLFLFERLAPEPPLIPTAIGDRMMMFGLANELLGENGFVWQRRLMIVAENSGPEADPQTRNFLIPIAARYNYSAQAAAAAPERAAEIVSTVARQLEAQRARGSRFMVGDRLSAVDIYWATSSAIFRPMSEELCPMGPSRKLYLTDHPALVAASSPLLFEHRDFIYRTCLELPIDLSAE